MPRPRQLPINGDRMHVVFPKVLAQRLRLLATHLGVPVSGLIQELVEERLPSKEVEVGYPMRQEPLRAVLVQGLRPIPEHWSGSDLKQRLYALNRTQKDLVIITGTPQQTLNRWARKGFVPPEHREAIRRVIEGWMAEHASTPEQAPQEGSQSTEDGEA